MKETYIISNNIISPIGYNTEENYNNILKGISGIQKNASPIPTIETIYSSKIDFNSIDEKFSTIDNPLLFTKVEKLLLLSIQDTFQNHKEILTQKDTLLIISTTKGNIDLLDNSTKNNFPENRKYLWRIGQTIQSKLGLKNQPLLISNACISGVNALLVAHRFIQEGIYANIIVSGVDILSDFVISGFQSFKAISPSLCKPFDKQREGINLGEACGTLFLSNTNLSSKSKIIGGAISNDANHISGPSRTGDGLYLAIDKALKNANIEASQIDIINAHGTATIYNDEMESKAFKLANLHSTPLNSLKGYYGHTLGAAGVVETIISIRSLENNELPGTKGFEEVGVPEPVSINTKLIQKESYYLLKTASGFGGGNGAIIIEKIKN